jgi:hypothetical protein
MKKQKQPTLSEKIKEVESQILANSKDAKFTKKLLKNRIELQKQADVVPVEISVPLSTITDEIDFGVVKIQRCAQGFLLTAKGGMQTLVSWRMNAVCEMIQPLYDWKETPTEDEEEQSNRTAYTNALLYVFQALLFASMGQQSLFEIATKILEVFNARADTLVDNALPSEETEADVKANIEAENEAKLAEQLVNEAENLPNYDD